MEPAANGLGGEDVEILQGRQQSLVADASDPARHAPASRSGSCEPGLGGRVAGFAGEPETLLGLVDGGGIQPELVVLGDEGPRAGSLANPPFAEDDRLASPARASQTPAHSLKAIEHDPESGATRHSHSIFGSRSIRSVTAARGDFPSKSTWWSAAVIGISTPRSRASR